MSIEKKRAEVNTKFGQITLIVTDGDHIYATTNPDSGRNAGGFNVRGVMYTVGLHFHRWSDGNFHFGEQKHQEYQRAYNSSYISRQGDLLKDVSTAARQAIIKEVEPIVGAWAAKNAGVISFAQVERTKELIERAEGELDELRDKMKAKEAEIKSLRASLK